MLLKKAQNTVTFFFILFMLINILGGITVSSSAEVFLIYFKIYAIHLSVILTFYFSQKSIKSKLVSKFSLGLLLFLLLSWNSMIMWIAYNSGNSVSLLQKNLAEFPSYAGFLIAGGIVWLFNGKTESNERDGSS